MPIQPDTIMNLPNPHHQNSQRKSDGVDYPNFPSDLTLDQQSAVLLAESAKPGISAVFEAFYMAGLDECQRRHKLMAGSREINHAMNEELRKA